MSTPESNGRPPSVPDAAAADAAAADAAADKLEEERNDEFDDGQPSGLEIAFTPRQILGGFALLAALILLLRRRKRDRID
jgi:MYXO-CTERM domain-containing protein